MYWTKRHVLVCTSQHCNQKGAMDVLGRLRLEIIRKRLDAEIFVNNCGTIDLCDTGPNMVIYPDNIIYGGVTASDIPDIVTFLQGGPVVERLHLQAGKRFEGKRRDFYAEIVERGIESEDEMREVARKHDLDEVMVDEQFRRGFMARKPVEGDEEAIRVHPTKKALTRYGLLSKAT
ncbi:MAG TPA: (2Fe-2S) ferredoxin domain-containing protein [Thermomicrobiales bacterium]|nr:(2Fe-2S) ferredoxin domain-containing protein [Thermomicrobiales bacterium]